MHGASADEDVPSFALEGFAELVSGCDLTEALWITLCPTTRDCRVIVDEDVRAVRHGLALIKRIDQKEELAILIASRVQILFVLSAELPVVEECVAVAIGLGIWIKTGRQDCRYSRGVRPELYVEEVCRVVPGGRGIQGRLSFWRERIVETLEHRFSPFVLPAVDISECPGSAGHRREVTCPPYRPMLNLHSR